MKTTPLTLLRSILFNICFTFWAFFAACIFSPLFICSARASQRSGPLWASVVHVLARIILGLRYEIRGQQYIEYGPCIYACKHQSAWDTIIFLTLFPAPAYVLKRELLRIPLWGWYLWRMQMIAINRHAGASSLKDLLKQSKRALEAGRPIVIFPEGTRTVPGAPPHYHPGILAMYNQLKVPVVPVALNSGVFWGKNAFTKHSGTIIMEFLPPIPPGLDKDVFMARMQEAIETGSNKLLAEALSTHQE